MVAAYKAHPYNQCPAAGPKSVDHTHSPLASVTVSLPLTASLMSRREIANAPSSAEPARCSALPQWSRRTRERKEGGREREGGGASSATRYRIRTDFPDRCHGTARRGGEWRQCSAAPPRHATLRPAPPRSLIAPSRCGQMNQHGGLSLQSALQGHTSWLRHPSPSPSPNISLHLPDLSFCSNEVRRP